MMKMKDVVNTISLEREYLQEVKKGNKQVVAAKKLVSAVEKQNRRSTKKAIKNVTKANQRIAKSGSSNVIDTLVGVGLLIAPVIIHRDEIINGAKGFVSDVRAKVQKRDDRRDAELFGINLGLILKSLNISYGEGNGPADRSISKDEWLEFKTAVEEFACKYTEDKYFSDMKNEPGSTVTSYEMGGLEISEREISDDEFNEIQSKIIRLKNDREDLLGLK